MSASDPKRTSRLPRSIAADRCCGRPNDPTGRFSYWPWRLAAGGQVLAPGHPELPIQFIDVRDLASWILRLITHRASGAFNATGPNDTASYRLMR